MQEAEDLRRAGKYDRAIVVAKKALDLVEKTLGRDHPDVVKSLDNLALLYKTQGQYTQAVPLYVRSLVILVKALGPDHPHVCASLENMAELYRATNRPKEADALDRRAAKIRAKKR